MKKCNFNFQNTYSTLGQEFYTHLHPALVPMPEMVVLNEALAEFLDLDFSGITSQQKAALFSGNSLPEGAEPLSQAYAGHQFGHLAMLGDGRAHLLGEHVTRAQKYDIQLKGSGRTPYSRSGDGKAALGPMLREYIISEAMHSLGIPTTRSLAVVSSGEQVFRESPLPGAILTRVAASHIRVGTFQYAAIQKDINLLQRLLDFTIKRHEPQLNNTENKALALLETVAERQADLIVHWMRVGFIHGVMNTDNMTLSGETIDYGPCAFMDAYHPDTVFSSIDQMGRYAYGNQPKIAQWNIARLAEALLPLIDTNPDKSVKLAEKIVLNFMNIYETKWLDMMRAKLGLSGWHKDDEKLISDFLNWMDKNQADYTNTFRDLGMAVFSEKNYYKNKEFKSWKVRWIARQQKNKTNNEAVLRLMKNTNPAVIPRNHNVEKVLKRSEEGNFKYLFKLLEILKDPYKEGPHLSEYQGLPEPDERVYQTFCGT